MKVVAVISARMASRRFPGKVMAPILGRPMLQLLLERVKRAKLVNRIVIATTTNQQDDCVYELAGKMGVGRFRGSESDVLVRVIRAADKYDGEIVVRLTGDNPLVDPDYIDKGIKLFLSGKYDYVANDNIELTMPRGMDVEIVTLKNLKAVNEITGAADIHEHVTLYFNRYPEKFRLKPFGAPKKDRLAEWHLAVDTKQDLELVKKIFEALYPKKPDFNYQDIVDLLTRFPDLMAINQRRT